MRGKVFTLWLFGILFCLPSVLAISVPVNDSFNVSQYTTTILNLTGNDINGSSLQIGAIGAPANVTIVDNGDGTVNFTSDPEFYGVITFNYTGIENGLYFAGTGHYYEFVSSGAVMWQTANTSANARNFSGLQGYLATIGSAAENNFVASRLSGQGWMGASDGAVEGEWRWVTGPEAGQQFWQGIGSGSVVGGLYNNWASGEPNDIGGEDYAHFLANGRWNDYSFNNGAIAGYVVEYDDLESDNNTFSYGYVTVNITARPANITLTSPTTTTYNLTNNVSINVSTDLLVSAWWYNVGAGNVSFTPNTTVVLDNANYTLFVYANTSSNGLVSSTNSTFTVDFPDSDGDGVGDFNDTLIGETVLTSGVNLVNVTVGGNSSNGTFSGIQNVLISDGVSPLINFSHNFSNTSINLSQITVNVSSLGMIVNMSGQLSTPKTIFVSDPGFVSFCVKDAEISVLSEISSGCDGINETDFTSCLGSSATINNITCTDLGSTLRVGNLTHSGAVGTLAVQSSDDSSSSSSHGGGGSYGYCGDRVCATRAAGETCSTCPDDCGVCPENNTLVSITNDSENNSEYQTDIDNASAEQDTYISFDNLTNTSTQTKTSTNDLERVSQQKNNSRFFSVFMFWILLVLILLFIVWKLRRHREHN